MVDGSLTMGSKSQFLRRRIRMLNRSRKLLISKVRRPGLRSVQPDKFSSTKAPRGTEITVKTHSSQESDLQYVIYVYSISGGNSRPSLIRNHAPSIHSKVRFDFKIPGLSLSSILSFPIDLAVGTLQHPEGGLERQRILPLLKHDVGILPNIRRDSR
ncbi:hypothetical protein N7471_013249 [Penicillium samsonianum]|uniref:uncharacterized protein n=1 Tax=Penicillium samsonianum TaxID=1882272 RepID=UPI0025477DFC|nr:uncharacterized protein N7471_013249 [Penicillium samsonianum]KAJ6118629.1 hypothetical protein N7471_013249 [Penicillium samsonianum]